MRQVDRAHRRARALRALALLLALAAGAVEVSAAEPLGPEQVVRAIVRANADRDLAGMARHMAKDADAVNYSIAGSKFVGWAAVEKALTEEFQTVSRLEMPIHELKVWVRGDFAYFSMELDYVRYIGSGGSGGSGGTGGTPAGTLVPLRETGVLERRAGEWILVAWHESVRTAAGMPQARVGPLPASTGVAAVDLSGTWWVEEADRAYEASVDPSGNGTYTWQGGQIRTTRLQGRAWEGTWHQPGNDREGGFELLLSDDGSVGQGHWWYTRVDSRKVPPRAWGGPYTWKRIAPAAR
jgi:ketosteroid isomerase-like protein